MKITILPKTESLKKLIKNHGAEDWVVLTNRIHERKLQTRAIKNNHLVWLTNEEFKTS
jgi:hypothetical protein